jgi:hypothetical protein
LTNTAERHAGFSKIFSLDRALESARRQKKVRTVIGVETKEYFDDLHQLAPESLLVPTPPRVTGGGDNHCSNEVRIGFLGSPQSQKRLDLVCKIIEETLVEHKPDLYWLLQLPMKAVAPSLLSPAGLRLEIHRGFLAEHEFEESLARLDALCIPYDPTAYLHNASALMYRASDNNLPMLCFRGSAFSREVEEFDLGWVVDNLDEMIATILQLDSGARQRFEKNFCRYNEFRLQTNFYFLGIDVRE